MAELSLKIGLFVAALRLLSAAGVPVLSILGNLTRAFFALNPAVVSAVSALAGFPGLVTALVAGAGTLGYGIGTLINQFVEWASGGNSVGGMLHDLVDAATGLNDEITRGATTEELAIARAKRLAREKEAQAQAIRKAGEEEKKAREKDEEIARAQEEKIKRNEELTRTNELLRKSFEAEGSVWDQATGKILRNGELTAGQLQQLRELGAALDVLGVKENAVATRITASGQEIIAAFRQVTQNAQATGSQINEAFQAAINGAKTEEEVRKIIAAYREWEATGGRTASRLGDLLAGTNARLQAHNQILFNTLDYETRINAVRYKNLSATERDSRIASDAQTLIAQATLARFQISENASEAEKKQNEDLRKGLLARADALTSQVQEEAKAVRLLGDLQRESGKLLEDTAQRADITAKIDADDKPGRKKMAGFIEWASQQEITIPVRLIATGNGGDINGLVDRLTRGAVAQ